MSKTSLQIADFIHENRFELAANTIRRFYVGRPEVVARMSQSDRDKGIIDVLWHYEFLAESIALQETEIFLRYCIWLQRVFSSLNFSDEVVLQIIRAIDHVLWEILPEMEYAVVRPYLLVSLHSIESALKSEDIHPTNPHNQSNFAQKLVALLREENEPAARKYFFNEFEKTFHSNSQLNVEIMSVMHEIGFLWQTRKINLMQEQAISRMMMDIFNEMFAKQPSNQSATEKVLAVTPPEELHEIGLRMVSYDFLSAGWNVVYVGTRSPILTTIQQILSVRPKVVLISVSMAIYIREAGKLIHAIKDAVKIDPPLILVGGEPLQTYAQVWKTIGADAVAMNGEEALEIVAHLRRNKRN